MGFGMLNMREEPSREAGDADFRAIRVLNGLLHLNNALLLGALVFYAWLLFHDPRHFFDSRITVYLNAWFGGIAVLCALLARRTGASYQKAAALSCKQLACYWGVVGVVVLWMAWGPV